MLTDLPGCLIFPHPAIKEYIIILILNLKSCYIVFLKRTFLLLGMTTSKGVFSFEESITGTLQNVRPIKGYKLFSRTINIVVRQNYSKNCWLQSNQKILYGFLFKNIGYMLFSTRSSSRDAIHTYFITLIGKWTISFLPTNPVFLSALSRDVTKLLYFD